MIIKYQSGTNYSTKSLLNTDDFTTTIPDKNLVSKVGAPQAKKSIEPTNF